MGDIVGSVVWADWDGAAFYADEGAVGDWF